MKKRKLLTLVAFALLGLSNAWAQKDVTSQYITNATLSDGTNGWTVSNFNTPQQGNNTKGYASEAYAGWGSLDIESYSLTQTITLPAGHYTLVNYSFFRQGLTYNTDAAKSLAFLKAGSKEVAIKTLGSINANGYANSQAEGANVFDSKMYRNTLDFTIDADNTEIEIGISGTFDLKQSWMIAGMFELIDNDTEATMDAPFDVTGYLTNPGFEYRDMSGWTLSADNAIGIQNNNQSFKVGDYYAQAWQSSANGALTERSMSQTISNLPPGYYKLTANLGGNGTYIDLNGKTVNWTADADYTVGYVLSEGEDLTVTVGKTAEGTANWIHFDNFKLYFCGDVAKALTTLVGRLSSYEASLPPAAYSTLETNVNAYNKSYSDVDELLDAIAAVQALYDKADVLVEDILAYNTALEAAQAVDQTKKMQASILNALQFAISTYETVDLTSQSALEEATAALNEATAAANTSIASYEIIASGSIPDNSLDGWVCENSNAFQINTWSVEGNSDGSNMKTPFIQNWVGKGSYLGAGKVYYKLEGLEPGEVYYAQALVRSYNEASDDAPNGPNFFINDVETNLTEAGTTFTYNNMSGIYATLSGAATVGNDGTLTLGVEIANERNYNWVAFKNVKIQSMSDALAATVEEAEALKEEVPESFYDDVIGSVITEYNKTWNTAEEYETAIAKITEATRIAELYLRVAELKVQAEELKENEDVHASAVQTLDQALNSTTEIETTEEAYNAAIDALQEAINKANRDIQNKAAIEAHYAVLNSTNVYTTDAYNAYKDIIDQWKAEYDADALTETVVAPSNVGWHTANSFDDYLLSTWYFGEEKCKDYDKDLYINTWSVEGNNDGTNFTVPFFEYWTGDGYSLGEKTLTATMTDMPAGEYIVTAWVRVRQKNGAEGDPKGITLSVNEGDPVDVAGGTQVGTSQFYLGNFSATGVVGEEGNLNIQFNVDEDNNISWLSFKNVTYTAVLTLNEEYENTEILDNYEGKIANVTLKRTLQTGSYNTFAVPFDIDIPEGWTVKKLTGSSLDAGTLNLEFGNATSIEAGNPYLVKVTSMVENPEFKGVTISSTTAPTEAGVVDFIPTLGTTQLQIKETDKPENFLFLGEGNNLYKPEAVGNDIDMKGFRAYFYLKIASAEAPVRAFNLDLGDGEQTTGIIEVKSQKEDASSEGFYDLMGRSIQGQPTQKGVYIKNGKKVIVK